MPFPWESLAKFLLFLSEQAIRWYRLINGQDDEVETRARRAAANILHPDVSADDLTQVDENGNPRG